MVTLEEKNVVFVTLDSCRYDVAEQAEIPTLRSIGELRKAYTHGSYTVAAHAAFFAGHLPIVFDEPREPFYTESQRQLWRIKTGLSGEDKPVGVLLEGNNIIDGYRRLGHRVLGVGGVTQFADNSVLRSYFGNDFRYYGLNIDEEPLSPRNANQFPLNHIDEIVEKLKNYDKWFLFVNCPETHYPYDIGQGISDEVKQCFPELKDVLNLREGSEYQNPDLAEKLKEMQRTALKYVDAKLGQSLNSLPKERDILVVVCGDHGENFGEYFVGRPRWGHLFPSPKVMEVPLVIGELK